MTVLPLYDTLTLVANLSALLLVALFALIWTRWPGWRDAPSGRASLALLGAIGLLALLSLLRRFRADELARLVALPTWVLVLAVVVWLLVGMLGGPPPTTRKD